MPIVILGTDAVLAALPATAVQLAHACLRAGYTNVIPASWGDELIASATLRRLAEFGDGPAIACSCPIVAHRLLSASADLRPVLLPFVPPPVAVARYVRTLVRPNRARVTYVGNCPGAVDDSIDIRMSPEALIAMLAERHIVLEEQPRVFESVIPADRRRFRSQPGGLPSADALWSGAGARTLVEIVDADDLATDVAQHVLAGESVLIDAAMALGCVCSGAVAGVEPEEGRGTVTALEPPRAASPVIDEHTPIELDMRLPAASRTPVDVMAVPATPGPVYAVLSNRGVGLPMGGAGTPTGIATNPDSAETSIRHASAPVRPDDSAATSGRQADGKERRLPRSYIVRRRPSPKSTPVVPDHTPSPRPPSRGERKAAQPIPAAEQPKNRADADARRGHTRPGSSGKVDTPSSHPGVAPTGNANGTNAKPVPTPAERESPPEEIAAEPDDPTARPTLRAVEPTASSAGSSTPPRVTLHRSDRDPDVLSVESSLAAKRAEANQPPRVGPGAAPGSSKVATLSFTSPAPDIHRYEPDDSSESISISRLAQTNLNVQVRHVVFMILAFVGVAILVTAFVAVMIERRFTTPITTPVTTTATPPER